MKKHYIIIINIHNNKVPVSKQIVPGLHLFIYYNYKIKITIDYDLFANLVNS